MITGKYVLKLFELRHLSIKEYCELAQFVYKDLEQQQWFAGELMTLAKAYDSWLNKLIFEVEPQPRHSGKQAQAAHLGDTSNKRAAS